MSYQTVQFAPTEMDVTKPRASGRPVADRGLFVFAVVALQFAAVVAVVMRFEVGSVAFRRVVVWAGAGFMVHYWLPRRLQMPFFALISIASTGLVLGLGAAGWEPGLAVRQAGPLLLIGLTLIGICRARVSLSKRIAALCAAACALAFARSGWLGGHFLPAVWPVLGSMFMFRLIVYAYDLTYETERPSLARSLAYFFMLPNACFPLYPVVDWKSFSREHSADEFLRTYQKGLQWLTRGLSQLILYRLVYHNFYIAPELVMDGQGLAQFLLSNYALYLHVSGQFHFIVGLLHLFGWSLPETNRNYFLAESFTDYWRRVNIYWKEFMLKIFYNPVAYRLRGRGAVPAVVTGSAAAFLATWALHSYQVFWLTGELFASSQDAVFWGTLGVLVVANAAWEASRRSSRSRVRKFGWRRASQRALQTAATFATICFLWSVWSSRSWPQWFGLWQKADATFLGWTVLALALVGACKLVEEWSSARPEAGRWKAIPTHASPSRILAVGITTCVLPAAALLLLANGALKEQLTPKLAIVLSSLTQNPPRGVPRGYYEDLLDATGAD